MKRLLALLTALILLAGTIPPAAAEEEALYSGTVTGGSLKLRAEPSSSGKVINTYKAGAKVQILENDGEWCLVQIGKNTGYMMTQYLKITPNYPHLGWARTPDDGTVLNVRQKADASSPVVDKAMSGGVWELVEEAGEWTRVRAGNGFGYIEKSRLTAIPGDYDPTPAKREEGVTAASLRGAVREIGSPMSMERTEGDFTYAVSYPALDIPAADARISAWVQDAIRRFEADHAANHLGTPGRLTVEYQALKLDERYRSVLLIAQYEVGSFRLQSLLTLNVDAEEGKLIEGGKALFSGDTMWPVLCLESAAMALMAKPAGGYDGKPDESWLQYVLLDREGIQVYLPAGRYLPAGMGTKKITLRYSQVAELTALSDAWKEKHKRVIDPTRPMIALTFDDGPSEETDRILRVLAEYDGRATFCVIGSKVEAYADVIRRAIAGGNEIACHTWSHPKLINLSAANVRSQIERTNNIVREVTGGYEIKVLRPPYGSTNKTVRSICADMGLLIAHWQVDTKDWATRNTAKTYKAIMKGAETGVIVLCHDLYSTTAAAAEQAIPELVAQGYQLVTVSELLSFHKDGAKPGSVYNRVAPENIDTGK